MNERKTAITREQAQLATQLVNSAESYGPLIALAGQLPSGIRAILQAAHDDPVVNLGCNAHWEGLECCLDILTDDPARYAPAAIAGARDLLRRYREQESRLTNMHLLSREKEIEE